MGIERRNEVMTVTDQRVSRLNSLPFGLGVATIAGLLLGAASLWVPPAWMLLAIAAGTFMFVFFRRPELVVLSIMLFTSTVFSADVLPTVSFGPVSLQVPDILLLGLFGLIAIRWFVDPDFDLIFTPLDWPVLVFYGVVLLSATTAVISGSLDSVNARREMRFFTYYLVFFAVINLVRNKRQLLLLIRGIFFLSVIVAIAMVAQFFLGERYSLVLGHVYSLARVGSQYEDVTRIIPPGLSLIFVGCVMAVVNLSYARRYTSSLFAACLGLLVLALVITFLRSYWVVSGFIFLIVLALLGLKEKVHLAKWGVILAYFAIVVLFFSFAIGTRRIERLVAASFERLGTLVQEETLTSDSLQGRYLETEYAIAQIKARPLLGVGVGGRYRPYDPLLDWGDEWSARRFIHNGHLWIIVKTGILGYLGFLWMSMTVLIRGFRRWRTISDWEIRGAVLSYTLVYLGLLVAAIVNSVFSSWFWTPLVGTMMGVNEVALRQSIIKEA